MEMLQARRDWQGIYQVMKNFTQIQETQRFPIKRNPKRPTPRHIIIKMSKFQDKERS